MGIFNLESPLMQALGKVADLLWLNVLTIICCIPIVTVGASFTAMNYVALKMARNEECYITRGFFKSFKENFKQATIIWLLQVLVILVLIGDYLIMSQATAQFPFFIKSVVLVVAVMLVFTSLYVYPSLARFTNPVGRTIKNAFMMSLIQFPKTLLMIVLYVIPIFIALFIPQILPIAFLFGLAAPAYGSAFLYGKFFKKLEEQILARTEKAEEEQPQEDDGEKIFSDTLLEGIQEDPELTQRPQS